MYAVSALARDAAISEAGAVLDRFRLLTEPSRMEGNKFRYRINPGVGGDDIPAAIEFNRLQKKQTQLAEEVAKKRTELAKAKAAQLWDSA
jgi:hypothetical protein